MGVAVAVLTEMKVTDNRYPHFTSGFKVFSSKAASRHQGGIALLWRENHPGVEVEVTRILTPNLLTFQLVTGNEWYYCMGVYIPPNDILGIVDLRSAWDACPNGCIPIVLGDLNINFRDSRDKREEQILDLLEEAVCPMVSATLEKQGAMDMAAQARGEDALFPARLYFGTGGGRATNWGGWLPMAPVS
jgi:hypothetical protein